ncbi:MAG TPA: protein kinase [Pyrinomonadaceae bacterium]|nr:protein kinase [Pyrinomonadaceae bacterium]
MIAAGTRLGRYEIRSKIGAGGMGHVYLAHDTQLGRLVALKILPPDIAADEYRMRRFMQEAKTASSLNQPNIITVFEIDETESTRFIVTEFIDGVTLRNYLAGKRLTVREALDIAMQVASALAAAHKAGIVHRDIKPENIMVRHDDGVVKVLDFGLAKPTETSQDSHADSEAITRTVVNTDPGVVMGTTSYMSPEQARGFEVDWRTDIWSLGVVLHEMIAGELPFEGPTKSDIVANILHKQPPALTLLSDDAHEKEDAPERLDEIVTKALTKDKDERYQDAKDLFIDLKRLKQHLDVQAEIRRTLPPDQRTADSSARPVKHQTAARSQLSAKQTEIAERARSTSAEQLITGIKRHKSKILIAALAAIVVVGLVLLMKSRNKEVLTEKDNVLLADFVNSTGDSVFDGTLKQAMAVQLGQSPFLNILSEDRVREALKFMGRSSDERINRSVGLEICQRQGLKAMLVGSIATMGNHYVITLEAINAQTGDAIAREQAEAGSKEQVLHALGQAAMNLREKLGESLQSIQEFDAPIEQATTSSLEAFKAFSVGVEEQLKGKYLEAIPFLRRATELDPNFALAYARMASMYYNSRQNDLAAEASQKAFELRDRVSERERLYISAGYYDNVTGEIEKCLETLELWKRTYPRDASPPNNLAVKYNEFGQFEKAMEAAREAIRLNPGSASGYSLLAAAFVGLDRFDEAKQIIAQAQAQKLESTGMRRILYRIAFVQGDAATMTQQIEAMNGKPDEYAAQGWQSESAAFFGQLRKARELSDRAIELAERRDLKDVAAQIVVGGVTRDASLGDCKQVKAQTARALGLSHSPLIAANAANALATCGEAGQAQTIIADLSRRFPNDTVLNKVMAPLVQARIELLRGNAAQALQLLEATRRYEGYALFQIAYLRGQIYLNQKAGADASAEFQRILKHRGSQPTSPLYSLAHFGLARAGTLAGDTARARQAYQDFFAVWRGADAEIPVLIEAKKEYEKLK